MLNGQYLNFRDMFDGGGAGASGSTFQGGGILSSIANMFFKPYGSQVDPSVRPQMPSAMPVAPQISAKADAVPLEYSGRGTLGMPVEPKQYSGRGYVGIPMESFVNTPEAMDVLDYLRGIGAVNY